MGKLIDLTGQRFGRLTVVGRAENAKNGTAQWLCQCDCGGTIIARGGNLCRGGTRSCGCLRKELAARQGHLSATHGKIHTRLYCIWKGMKARCYNPHDPYYGRYGGRGITICEEWVHDFQAFYDWAMSHGYSEDLTIDRIDNDKGYSPDNCRWATTKEQARGMSTNRRLTIGRETKTLAEWCEIYGKKRSTVRARIDFYGWTIEEALDLVPRKK